MIIRNSFKESKCYKYITMGKRNRTKKNGCHSFLISDTFDWNVKCNCGYNIVANSERAYKHKLRLHNKTCNEFTDEIYVQLTNDLASRNVLEITEKIYTIGCN